MRREYAHGQWQVRDDGRPGRSGFSLGQLAVGNVGVAFAHGVLRAARATLRPVLRAVRATLRPVLRAVRAVLRPALRAARATFRPVLRAVRAVLRAVRPVVAISFLHSLVLHFLQTFPSHSASQYLVCVLPILEPTPAARIMPRA